jgi:hypothetical protein
MCKEKIINIKLEGNLEGLPSEVLASLIRHHLTCSLEQIHQSHQCVMQ